MQRMKTQRRVANSHRLSTPQFSVQLRTLRSKPKHSEVYSWVLQFIFTPQKSSVQFPLGTNTLILLLLRILGLIRINTTIYIYHKYGMYEWEVQLFQFREFWILKTRHILIKSTFLTGQPSLQLWLVAGPVKRRSHLKAKIHCNLTLHRNFRYAAYRSTLLILSADPKWRWNWPTLTSTN